MTATSECLGESFLHCLAKQSSFCHRLRLPSFVCHDIAFPLTLQSLQGKEKKVERGFFSFSFLNPLKSSFKKKQHNPYGPSAFGLVVLLGFVSSSFPPPCPFASTIKHSGRAAQRQLSIPGLSYSTCGIRACSFDYGQSHLRCCLQSLFSSLSQDPQKQSCGWSAGGVQFWQQGRTNGAPHCLPLRLPGKGGQAVVGIAVPPCGETSRASLGTHRRVGRWQREGPITLGFPLIPSADAETGGRKRRGVPWYRLAAHPFTFDLQQIEERAMPNGRLSQTGSVPHTLGAGLNASLMATLCSVCQGSSSKRLLGILHLLFQKGKRESTVFLSFCSSLSTSH
ncbi:uncharacterized protein ACIBXB_013127 [Morphnus guianensis]